jgi:hypothetical protein
MEENTNIPTDEDIQYLKDNPEQAEGFNKQFGEGASGAHLKPQPTPEDLAYLEAHPEVQEQFNAQFGEQPSQETPQEPEGLGIGGTLLDMGKGVLNGAEEAVNQTISAAANIDDGVGAYLGKFGIPRLSVMDEEGNFDLSLKTHNAMKGDQSILGGKVGVSGDEVQLDQAPEPVSMAGTITEGISQFAVGFLGAGKFTGVAGVKGALLNGALADGVVFDPDDANLSGFMQEHEYAIPVLTAALATDPDDPEWLNRVRNSAEGALVGVAMDTTVRVLKGLARKVKGDKIGGPEGKIMVENAEDELADLADIISKGETPEPFLLTDAIEPKSIPSVVRKDKPLVDGQVLKEALATRETVTMDDIANSKWFNTDKFDGGVEAQSVIESVGKALKDSGALEKLKLNAPETFEDTIKGARKELAEMIGSGTGRFERRLGRLAVEGKDQASVIVAGKMTLQTLGTEIDRVAKQMETMGKEGNSSLTVENRLIDLLETHANVQGHLKAAQTSAARATSAGRIRTTSELPVEALQERIAKYGGSERLKGMARDLQAAKGPAQRAKMIRSQVSQKTWGVINEIFINNILSGSKTHAVNMFSNTINIAVLPAERILGGTVQGLQGKGFGQAREGVAQYMAIRSVAMDAIRLAGQSFKNEAPILDSAVKVEYAKGGYKAISSSAFGVDANTIGGSLLDTSGKLLRLPTRMLGAEDEFFKQLIFRSRLQAKLSVAASEMSQEALDKAGYASKGDFVASEFEKAFNNVQSLSNDWDEMVKVGKVMDDPTVKEKWVQENLGGYRGGNKYADDALRNAREGTFTTPLIKGTISDSYQKMANRHPVLRQITPFIQTPVNILSKAFDRTPALNLLRTRYRDRLASPDPSIRAEAQGEMATGVAIATSVYMLASEGRITGGGPTDGKKRALWQADKNWQPYSLNVGTTEEPDWVEYKRFDPHGFLLGFAGDIAEMKQASQDDPSFDTAGLFAMMVSSIGNNLTSKAWLQGISDTVEVLNSKDRPYVAQRWAENKVASFVPYSSMGRTVNQAMNPEMKEARGFIDNIKKSTIGMSDSLPSRFDWVTGKEIESPSHYLGFIKHSKGDNDVVTKELRELNYGFSGADRKIGKIALSSEMFQDWNRLMGTTRIGGRTLKEKLERTMQSARYDMVRDKTPDDATTPAENHRVRMLAKIMSRYKAKSRAELFDKYPDLEGAYTEYRDFKNNAKSGRAEQGERENLILEF